MNPEQIVDIVCKVCRIEVADLRRRSRAEPVSTARALITHFLYKELRMSPRQIYPYAGHTAGNRTSVYHYLGHTTLVERRLPYQKPLQLKVAQIEQLIESQSSKA